MFHVFYNQNLHSLILFCSSQHKLLFIYFEDLFLLKHCLGVLWLSTEGVEYFKFTDFALSFLLLKGLKLEKAEKSKLFKLNSEETSTPKAQRLGKEVSRFLC